MKHIKKFENIIDINKELLNSIKENNIENVKYYIEKGADVNYYDTQLDSFPLMEVVGLNAEIQEIKDIKYEIAKILLENGANPDQRDSLFFTPLMIASQPLPYFNIIELLIKYNADWNLKDKFGKNFIDILNKNKYDKFVNDLIKNIQRNTMII